MIRSIIATTLLLAGSQFVTQVQAQTCSLFPLVGHQANTSGAFNDVRNLTQPADCCDACDNDVQCQGFTWTDMLFDPLGNHCFLFDSPSDGCAFHPNCVSGNPAGTPAPPPCPATYSCPQDDNLEVLLPPLLDDANTHVVLTSTNTDMQVKIIIPSQYETVKVSFENAADDAATFDSTDLTTYGFWELDYLSDPCNKYLTGTIPWDMFRTTLGGVAESRFFDAVNYATTIEIETSFELELTPETLLEKEDVDLLQTQTHTRYVRTKIPFEVTFDLSLKLWASANVESDHLRVTGALIDTTVLTVDPDSLPIATARLEFVTVIPLPLILDSASINVSDSDLAYGLSVSEVVAKRDCVESQEFCTQHWEVLINPKKCTLDGQYVALMTGACHPDSTNCLAPSPDTTTIVMDVVSDDYCGVSQEVDIVGSLSLQATACNGYMQGTVTVANPDGGAINYTEIVELHVSPTLLNSQFLAVYDEGNSIQILDYSASLTQPNQVDFEFLWAGAELRCDVVASVDAVVLVEFEATRPLLLAIGDNAAEAQPRHQRLFDDQSVRMVGAASVGADNSRPTTGTNGDIDAANTSTAATSTSAFSSPLVVGLIAGLSALVVLVIAGGLLYARRISASTAKATDEAAPEATPATELAEVAI